MNSFLDELALDWGGVAVGWASKVVGVWAGDGLGHGWAQGDFFSGHLGKGQFDVEETVVAEAGLDFALGQVNLGKAGWETELAVELAHDVVFLAFLDVVGGFDDDATFLAVESAGDFFGLES